MRQCKSQIKSEWIHIWVSLANKARSNSKFKLSPFFLPFAESPYPVTGLPDPYMDQMQMQMGEDQIDHSKAPHMSLDYDETSGYSTPNSRNRRVIREIIV
jgi:hypothetical protein